MEQVKIIFADSTEVIADKNANTYITNSKFDVDDTQLMTVTIIENDIETILNNCTLQECASIDGRYWFSIREIPETMEEARQLRADVDYLLAITE